MFRSDSQRRAAFANMFSSSPTLSVKFSKEVSNDVIINDGVGTSLRSYIKDDDKTLETGVIDKHKDIENRKFSGDNYSVKPEHVKFLESVSYDGKDANIVKDYYLNEMSPFIAHKRDGESDDAYLRRADESDMLTLDEANILIDNKIGGGGTYDNVSRVDTLDDYFDMYKEKIENSRNIGLDGGSTVIEVEGDKSIDVGVTKKTIPRDYKKFSDDNKFSSTPALTKELRDAYVVDTSKPNVLGKGIEDMVLYPGAMSYNPVTAFDDDWGKFNRGEIFDHKGTTDWKKFSLRPSSSRLIFNIY